MRNQRDLVLNVILRTNTFHYEDIELRKRSLALEKLIGTSMIRTHFVQLFFCLSASNGNASQVRIKILDFACIFA